MSEVKHLIPNVPKYFKTNLHTHSTITDGKYETKVELEAQGMSCVILEKPQVTKADAYASAFAITTDCDEENYERAMEIIYEINTNVHFRNLLQYGVKNTNYTIDDNNFITFIEGDSSYKMNLLYTGDLFIAYYVDGVYTPDTKKNGEKQNLEASYVPPVMEDTSEGGETPEA